MPFTHEHTFTQTAIPEKCMFFIFQSKCGDIALMSWTQKSVSLPSPVLCACVYVSVCVRPSASGFANSEEVDQKWLQQCQEAQLEWPLIPEVVCITVKDGLSPRLGTVQLMTPTQSFLCTAQHKQISPLSSFYWNILWPQCVWIDHPEFGK